MLRGYDVDGVLVGGGVIPQQPYVVISGRLPGEWARTVGEIGCDAPIYLRPTGNYGDHNWAGEWKAHMIGLLGVTEFYEDEPFQASIIEAKCPDCKVILIRR